MAKCGNCDFPLICAHCGSKFTFANEAMYEAFYDRIQSVVCPNCQKVLTCRYCNYSYDADKYEYQDQSD
jgi:primosomal protein N'